MALWKQIVDAPDALVAEYRQLWEAQQGREQDFYLDVRKLFNSGQQPHHFLYLLARCVKAAIRYNRSGEFNNSPDNRRKGMHPDTMLENIRLASALLAGHTELSCTDFNGLLPSLRAGDVVYMDPPYQGVCGKRDPRYCHSIKHDDFVGFLCQLNEKGIAFIVSYDGRTGDKQYGAPLPASLGLKHHEVHVGRSTQSTLLGRDDETFESIYLSPVLLDRLGHITRISKPAAPRLFAIGSK